MEIDIHTNIIKCIIQSTENEWKLVDNYSSQTYTYVLTIELDGQSTKLLDKNYIDNDARTHTTTIETRYTN